MNRKLSPQTTQTRQSILQHRSFNCLFIRQNKGRFEYLSHSLKSIALRSKHNKFINSRFCSLNLTGFFAKILTLTVDKSLVEVVPRFTLTTVTPHSVYTGSIPTIWRLSIFAFVTICNNFEKLNVVRFLVLKAAICSNIKSENVLKRNSRKSSPESSETCLVS